MSQPQVLTVPNMYTHAPTGPVRTIDWSSDGYVLAVGWEHVAGRCGVLLVDVLPGGSVPSIPSMKIGKWFGIG
jgi:hypothetical protein